jgi:hypothetical protein
MELARVDHGAWTGISMDIPRLGETDLRASSPVQDAE